MKQLKLESKIYFENVRIAIKNCYSQNEVTTNNLMNLYNEVGRQISLQGEKAFVSHVEKMLKTEFAEIKGFSARNLRRMRAFYETYKETPELKEKSMNLNFTINSIILEKCETAEEKEFYIALASKETLSKLSLLAAIEDEKHLQIATSEVCDTPCATVSDFIEETKVNTQQNIKKLFDTLVTICEKSIVNTIQKYYNILRKERQRNYIIGELYGGKT
ncbi:MAG: DUF1016 N-terminal domain-containing protein [Clostridia bacterium]